MKKENLKTVVGVHTHTHTHTSSLVKLIINKYNVKNKGNNIMPCEIDTG